MDILRIAVLGIAGVLLALLLQKEKSETRKRVAAKKKKWHVYF